MKTTNENDNRFTRDVLLRQIFQEISDENRENSPSISMDDLIPTPEKRSPKRNRVLLWIFIIIFVTGITYLWFYTVTEVTQEKEVQTKNDSTPTPQPDQIKQIVEEKEVIELPEVVKKKPKKHIIIEVTDPNDPIDESLLKDEVPKTEREKAKEALMLQMQN